MSPTLDLPLGLIVATWPGAALPLERAGLDWGIDGHLSLAEACEARGVAAERVLAATRLAPPTATRWSDRPLSAVVRHLITDHHAPLEGWLDEVVGAAALARVVDSGPEADAIVASLSTLREELIAHTAAEERVVFPAVLAGGSGWRAALAHPFDQEHHRVLVTLRALHDAGAARHHLRWRSAAGALQALQRRLRDHFHLETWVLYPRLTEAAA